MAAMASLSKGDAQLKTDRNHFTRDRIQRDLNMDFSSPQNTPVSRPRLLAVGDFGSPGRPASLGSSTGACRRRPRLENLGLPPFSPSPSARSPDAAEIEAKLQKVMKLTGIITVNGIKYATTVDDLEHLGDLGNGTCGHVVKMLHKPSRKVIAVKQMRRTGNREETKRILMDLEVVLQSHDCPYIVQCLGCFIRDADVWICMELMATCLDKLIKKLRQPFPEPIIGKVSVATLRALHYLKENHGVIHRDVKPSNILIDEKGCVKLCDFGISARLVESKAKTRNAGCAAYMAPERIEPPDPSKPDYDIRADVWSLGITLVELATGQLPYHDCKTDFEVLTRVLNDDPPRLPEISKFSREFRYFVQDCLTKDYRQRPKYRKLLEYPFIIRYEGVPVDVAAWYAGVCQQIEAHEPHSQVGSGATRGNSPKKLGVSSSGGSPRVAPKPTREVSQMFPSSSNSSSSPSLYRVPLSREPSPLRVGGKPLPSPVVPRRPSRENSPCPSRSALASNASNSGTSVNSPFVRHHSLTRESPHYGQHSHIGGSLRGEPRDWGSYSTDIQQPPSPPRETPPSVVFYPNKNLYVFQRSAPDSSDLLERGASSRLGLLPPRSDNSSSTKRIAGQLLSRFLGRNKPTPNVGSESGKWYLPSPIPSSRRRLSDTASSPTSHPTPFFMRPTYTPEPVRKFH